MTESDRFSFAITPRPMQQTREITATQGREFEIWFTIQNTSGRPLSVEALPNVLAGPSNLSGEPLAPGTWQPWITIPEDKRTWSFGPTGEHELPVKVSLPGIVNPGSYTFELLLVGLEDPDHLVYPSPEVSFRVVTPPVNMQRYLLAGLAFLAAIVLLILGAVIFLQPRPGLVANLKPPVQGQAGSPLEYSLVIDNPRATTASNVTFDYSFPQGIIGANVTAGEKMLDCEESTGEMRCLVGDLAPGERLEVAISAWPEPTAEKIDHQGSLSVTSLVPGGDPVTVAAKIKPDATPLEPVNQAQNPLPVFLNPSSSLLHSDEVSIVHIQTWNALPISQTVVFTYHLPGGLHYAGMPQGCEPFEENDSRLICVAGLKEPYELLDLPIQVQANSGTASNEHRVEVTSTALNPSSGPNTDLPGLTRVQTQAGAQLGLVHTTALTATLPVVSSALVFDGRQSWAELGYHQLPQTFSVQAWVSPRSTLDGQAFIGAHGGQGGKVLNLFLVGYWNGSLHVNVRGASHNLETPKVARRFHLTVVVKAQSAKESLVNVYIDGQPQRWLEPDGDDSYTKRFETVADSSQTRPWVLGQEWDNGDTSPRQSDFFHGALSEIRLWTRSLSMDEITQNMDRHLRGDEPGLAGYWRLDPAPGTRMPGYGRDAGPGERYGAYWQPAQPDFGQALQFDGWNNVLHTSEVQFSNFTARPDGKVEVTLAAWVQVDGVPSQPQWVLGHSIPLSGQTLTRAAAGEQAFLQPVSDQSSEVEAAQAELIRAMQARQELQMSEDEARDKLTQSRDQLYRDLWPLRSAALDTSTDTGVFAPLKEVRTQALAATGNDPGKLNKVTGLPEAAGLRQQAQTVFEQVSARRNQAQQPEVAWMRAETQLGLADLDWTQAALNAWNVASAGPITVTDIFTGPLDLNLVEEQQDVIDGVTRSLEALPPPDRALLALAALELAEGDQLAVSIHSANAETLSRAQIAANERILAAQEKLDEMLKILQDYLQRNLGAVQSGAGLPSEIQNGLIGYWDFNEGRGSQVADRSPAGNQTGVLKGNAGFISSVPVRAGSANPYALVLDGKNASVEIPLKLDDKQKEFTLAFWLWVDEPPVSNQKPQSVLRLGGDDFWFVPKSDNNPSVLQFTDEWTLFEESPFDFELTRNWVYVALVFTEYNADDDTVTIKPYVNSVESETYDREMPDSLQRLILAPVPSRDDTARFAGRIDELMVYSKALAPEQVEQLGQYYSPQQEYYEPNQAALSSVENATQAQIELQTVQQADRDLTNAQQALQTNAERRQEEQQIAAAAQANALVIRELEQSLAQTQQVLTALMQQQTERVAPVPATLQAQNQAAAQALVDAASLALTRVRASSPASTATILELETVLAQAQIDLAAISGNVSGASRGTYLGSTPQDVSSAQAKVAATRQAITGFRRGQLAALAQRVQGLKTSETSLAGLEPQIQQAISEAVKAGMTAAQQNNVELVLGPFLDWVLGTQTLRKTTYQAVYPAAMLAAQIALKSEEDGAVDQARARYQEALTRQDLLFNSRGNERIKQEILKDIEAYRKALNAEVETARNDLETALQKAEAKKDQPEIPLALADALAQSIAQSVAVNISNAMRPDYRNVWKPNPALSDRIEGTLQAAARNDLEAVRRPQRLRLYYDTFFTIQRLESELAAGTDDPDLRALKTKLRDELLALNTALLRVLYAQQIMVNPDYSFRGVLNQVAAGETTTLDQLLKDLNDRLGSAETVLKLLIQYQESRPVNGLRLPAEPLRSHAPVGLNPGSKGQGPWMSQFDPFQLLAALFLPETANTGPRANPLGGAFQQEPTPTPDPLAPPDLTATQTPLATPNPTPTPEIKPANILAGLLIDRDGHMLFAARSAGSQTWAVARDENPVTTTGEWVHFAGVLVYNARSGQVESISLVRNGQRVKYPPSLASNEVLGVEGEHCPEVGLYIGGLCSPAGQNYFAGRLDEVRIWNRALAPADIERWRNLPGAWQNELAYWSFDSAPGRDSASLTPGGYRLEINGPLWVTARSSELYLAP